MHQRQRQHTQKRSSTKQCANMTTTTARSCCLKSPARTHWSQLQSTSHRLAQSSANLWYSAAAIPAHSLAISTRFSISFLHFFFLFLLAYFPVIRKYCEFPPGCISLARIAGSCHGNCHPLTPPNPQTLPTTTTHIQATNYVAGGAMKLPWHLLPSSPPLLSNPLARYLAFQRN